MDLPILVDMDSIVVSMTPVWLKKYYERTGDLVKESDIKTWEFDSFVKHKEVFHDIIGEDGFFYNLDPIPGAVEAITKLMEKGKYIVFLTQPPRKSDYAVKDKRKWIQKYFPKFDLQDVMFSHRKKFVMGNALVDDSPKHLASWKYHMDKYTKILTPWTIAITYEYNKDIKTSWRFEKDKAWPQIYKILCTIKCL
jgi:5'(3')-deoxyribonucleotidase